MTDARAIIASVTGVGSDAERRCQEALDLILWDFETTLQGLEAWARARLPPSGERRLVDIDRHRLWELQTR